MKKISKILALVVIAIIAIASFSSCNSRKKEMETKYNSIISDNLKITEEYLNPSEKWSEKITREIETRATEIIGREIEESDYVINFDYSFSLKILRKRFTDNPDSLINFIYPRISGISVNLVKNLDENEIGVLKNVILNELRSTNDGLGENLFVKMTTGLIQLMPDTLTSLVKTGYFNQFYLEILLRLEMFKENSNPIDWAETLNQVKDSIIVESFKEIGIDSYLWDMPEPRIIRILQKFHISTLGHEFYQTNDENHKKILKNIVIQKLNGKSSAKDIYTAWYYDVITEETLITYYQKYPPSILVDNLPNNNKEYLYLIIDKVQTRDDYVLVAEFFANNQLPGYLELLRKEKGCEK